MKRFLQGVGVGAVLFVLLGLVQQHLADEPPVVQRYMIYPDDESGPLLLDTQTGRTWYEEPGPLDSAGDETPSTWAPARFDPDDSDFVKLYRPPGG
ncbi:MAG TPA: hypothetical protein VMH39_00940, partial [Gemmatimonadaceae bacterium]|nr:hypothetical protein [Gemmatimonadaceae bacterium]